MSGQFEVLLDRRISNVHTAVEYDPVEDNARTKARFVLLLEKSSGAHNAKAQVAFHSEETHFSSRRTLHPPLQLYDHGTGSSKA